MWQTGNQIMNPVIKAIVALRAALMLMPAGGARELVEDAVRELEAALPAHNGV